MRWSRTSHCGSQTGRGPAVRDLSLSWRGADAPGPHYQSPLVAPCRAESIRGFLMNSMKNSAINNLLKVMAKLRSPAGCPWDRQQNHLTLRYHAVEEVYELMDAIEADDDHEMREELGDLLLQVVFHC